ncbi:MAG: EAL domain-containing protein [Burkholderiales bacterium]
MTFANSHSPGALAEDDRFDLGAWAMLSPDYAAWAREASVLAGELDRGLASGELYAVIQPRMALVTGGGLKLAGGEMLVRWRHPQRGFVPPNRFIPIAEATGLIEPLGDFMLDTAARTLSGWLARYGHAPSLAVNLSARQFTNSRLPEKLEQLRINHDLPSGLIELEITESAAMRDAARTVAILGDLRAVRVPVSIDDFGTGFSSLAYLRQFEVDALKIDKSLIDDIGVDPNANAVCNAILQLGHTLGIKTVAEGVEHVRQLEYLRLRECDEVQGYFFGKPVEAEIFERERLVC